MVGGKKPSDVHAKFIEGFYKKSIMIITYFCSNVKFYDDVLFSVLNQEELVCPVCGGKTHSHGFYERKLRIGDEKVTITIARVKCVGCKKTHAILPDFISPYKHYWAAEIECVVEEFENGTKATQVESPASDDTVKRWLSSFIDRSTRVVGVLYSILYSSFGKVAPSIGANTSPCLSKLKSILNVLPKLKSSGLIFGEVNMWLSSASSDTFLC